MDTSLDNDNKRVLYLNLSSFEQRVIQADGIVNAFLVSELNISKPTTKQHQHDEYNVPYGDNKINDVI